MNTEPTDPYTPPKASSTDPPESAPGSGRVCPACGSRNTGLGILTQRQPDLVYLLFFGWLYLFKIAFVHRKDTCRDCGETFRYKTIGSWIALILLVLSTLLVLAYLLISS